MHHNRTLMHTIRNDSQEDEREIESSPPLHLSFSTTIGVEHQPSINISSDITPYLRTSMHHYHHFPTSPSAQPLSIIHTSARNSTPILTHLHSILNAYIEHYKHLTCPGSKGFILLKKLSSSRLWWECYLSSPFSTVLSSLVFALIVDENVLRLFTSTTGQLIHPVHPHSPPALRYLLVPQLKFERSWTICHLFPFSSFLLYIYY
ncbi:hypothetical protein SERLA73DRAFT_112075, partial [Serpula lacrymans var. lacrymans S7.3]